MRGVSLFKGLFITLREFFRRRVTVYYPEEMLEVPLRSGMPALLIDPETYNLDTGEYSLKCTACGVCAKNCPDRVITVTRAAGERKQPEIYEIDFRGCMFCGICIEVCPFDALGMQRFYENAVYNKDNLILDKERLIYKENYPELMNEGERKFFERKRKEFRL